jgi:hypothetical protein
MNLQPNQHLNHEQLCDLLIDAPNEGAHQEHLRDCLICASELDLMRSSTAVFQQASTAIADRELARRPIRPFASLHNAQPGSFINLAFVWATAAVVIAAIIPLGLNSRLNPMTPDTTITQPATTSEAQSSSDADLLNGIDQDLSAAIPTPMQPLAGPVSEYETAASDTQNQN